MLEELKLQSLQKNGPVIHPNISGIIFDKGVGYCIKHYKKNGMNVGAMKQHLRSKAHNINPETGIPLDEIDLSKIIKETKNQEEIRCTREEFDDYYHMVKKIFELKDPIQGIIVANNVFEGYRRDSIVNYLTFLNLKEIQQAEAEKKKAENEKKKAENEKMTDKFEKNIARKEKARQTQNLRIMRERKVQVR